ncbi:MAG: nitroreductase family deazaflavin-dependent oxidoreductase [Nocardioides sp.]
MASSGSGLSPEQIARRRRALAKPLTTQIMRRSSRLHVKIFRLTRGRIGSKWRVGAGFRKPVLMLLLDHVGRKSGTAFTTPLLYLDDGADVVVVASQGGAAKNPQWYANLMTHPDTTVQIKDEVRRVRARTATTDEREVLWPRLVGIYADYADYQATTDRVIPVVVLEPR